MANYLLQKTSRYDITQLDKCVANGAGACVELDQGEYARFGTTLQHSGENLKKMAAQRKYGKPVLAVGDFIEVFEMPTYARMTDLSVFHDCSLGDFRFELEVADVIYGANNTRTATKRAGVQAIIDTEAGTTVTYGTALAALPVIGAAVGRESFHFGGNVRNNQRAVVRLKITAVPAAPAAGAPASPNFFDLSCLNFYATFEQYAACLCCDKCQGAYDKAAVTTIA